jgi:hypothetical protein
MDPNVVKQLKGLAKAHRRSLQAEVRAILEDEAARGDRQTWTAWLDDFRASAGSPADADAVDLLRESRDER